jgi:hypothetical protein
VENWICVRCAFSNHGLIDLMERINVIFRGREKHSIVSKSKKSNSRI